MLEINVLCDMVREIGFALHVYLGPGHLEKVYENAFVHRLRKAGLNALQQHPIKVHDEDGTCIGEYYADILIEGCLIIELKAARSIANEHIAQLLGYLRATNIKDGLLINFGGAKYQIRKFAM